MHDYFYGVQSEQFSFIRIPTLLFTDDQYKYVSAEAKGLYGILLARMDLSAKNGWIDDHGRVYIICTLSEIMEKLNCADNKATKLMIVRLNNRTACSNVGSRAGDAGTAPYRRPRDC